MVSLKLKFHKQPEQNSAFQAKSGTKQVYPNAGKSVGLVNVGVTKQQWESDGWRTAG